MQISILFLGTGTGPAVTGKGVRSSGGIILTLGSNQFHIDPGIGAVMRASEYGVNLRETTCILLSHAHVNHTNDVNGIIEAMTYAGLDKKGVLIANKTCLKGTDEYSPIITQYHRNLVERFIAVDRDQKIGINEVEIQTITARHNEPNTIGFKFIVPGMTITYSSDTVYAPDIVEQYAGSDVLILNIPFIKKMPYNLCLEEAVTILNAVRPRAAILTHFSHEMINADPLYEAREVQKQTKVPTFAAKDGMLISPVPFQESTKKPDDKDIRITVDDDHQTIIDSDI
jgi:ribonuclease BN (tRNA processing enzyme)